MKIDYSISVRGKAENDSIIGFLNTYFKSKATSVFGFSKHCKLYGGRPYFLPELSEDDFEIMEASGIGYRIPLQNTLATEKDFYDSFNFLERHHRQGNSVILARDRFVPLFREHFPLYEIEASVIKNIHSVENIIKSLDKYDTVVPDPYWFENKNPTIPLEYRPRLRLFANAGCMYTCPERICYTAVSKMNLGVGKFRCSATEGVKRDHKGSMYDLNVERYINDGYTKFKLLRSNGTTGY